MECNRDEATRAKLIAEDKLDKGDFAAAKKFALKAQTLYPGLDGITQLLTILSVYVSAENKVGGEIDWYGVLGVMPFDDDETIKKQYRRLALMLHPDKNKSVGADGAFKLISEAWSLLSDKMKRLAYNQWMGSRGFNQKVQMRSDSGASAPSKVSGIFDFTRGTTSIPKTEKNIGSAPCQRTNTFWTICRKCNMHYEYPKKYLNNTLLCPTCHEAFIAFETAPPSNLHKHLNQVPRMPQKTTCDLKPGRDAPVFKTGPGQQSSNLFRQPVYKQDPVSGTSGVSTVDCSGAGKAANVVQQVHDEVKREHTEFNASTGSEKKRKLVDDRTHHGKSSNMAQGNGKFGVPIRGATGSRIYGFDSTFPKSNSTRYLTTSETRKMLIQKARKEILNKLTMKSEATAIILKKEKSTSKENKHGRDKGPSNIDGHNRNGMVGHSMDIEEYPKETFMTVPDPDFHDFDLERGENSFGDSEVWAAYDDDDGMPRFYALISKVISRKPFKLRISWLNSKTNSEFSTIDWVGSGFYKTSGEFRVGKYETCKSINAFSQKVNWSKRPGGSILILPQKGEVWSLYRNWSSDWNEHTPDEVIHKYEMVTVVDDYTEEHGLSVAPLVKVSGFKTVFSPNMDPKAMKRIPKEEMFRFSHRVPYHLLTGLEAQNAPKGCLELDPAATPIEFLQVNIPTK